MPLLTASWLIHEHTIGSAFDTLLLQCLGRRTAGTYIVVTTVVHADGLDSTHTISPLQHSTKLDRKFVVMSHQRADLYGQRAY